MSLYYNSEIVRMLTAERLREAQEARSVGDLRASAANGPSPAARLIARIFSARTTPEPRPTATTTACTC